MTAPSWAQARDARAQRYTFNSPMPMSKQVTLPAESAGFHLITFSWRHAGSKI